MLVKMWCDSPTFGDPLRVWGAGWQRISIV
ncbi:hypothetical protein GA0116948_101496 [Chitinophaga costaii]|uniref:Uncharacterized protein n=1 Tax=Chitinophaga costaii TaxID=1335309 RepID=A0A1C3ZPQ7_9BACT|nr:hypothetical protein GA0116948_101496 [Chitinophaga costaii]